MTPSFQDRWIAAQNAEDKAQREQASALASGVAMVVFLAMLFVWFGLICRSF